MQKIEMLVGIPGAGKSTYCKELMKKEPGKWKRINNDDLRNMVDNGVWSQDNEKAITDLRNHMIRDYLKRGSSILIDNLNINRRHFDNVCKIAKSVNVDVQIFERAFYIELDEAMERNAKREGAARVPDDVVKKWWKDSGGKGFKFYKPRVEIFQQRQGFNSTTMAAPDYIQGLPEAVLCDLDGTLALIHGRSPYDATDCDIKDLPNRPVIETVLAHYKAGRKIIFCSGREDKYRPETIRFIEKHCKDIDSDGKVWDIEYNLFMRKTDDFRKDAIIKEEIYQNEIEGKYNVLMVLDDRDSVVQFWRDKGLTCFQVAPGDF
jgi:predicted kinase